MTVNDKREFYLPRNLLVQFLDKVSPVNEVMFTIFIFTREKFQKSREKMKNWRYFCNIQLLLASRTWCSCMLSNRT